jgi:N-acetyl-alpha-D-muramate 1-phosphate uridylyltransferase
LPLLGEAFFVLYGDSYLPCNYPLVEQIFLASGKQGLMTVYRNEGRWDRSNVEYSGNRILEYDKVVQSSRMLHIDYGLGVFRSTVFDALPENRPVDLAVVYQELLQRGELAAFEAHERFYEIGSVEGIRELGEFIRK